MDPATFDVVIVGGRPAGASLAARLGAAGLRVLIVERATFPSAPAVSAPFLLPHALALVDEVGVDEAAYTVDTPQLRSFVLELAGYFRSVLAFDAGVAGRSYFYTVDRAQLDHALWRSLAAWPSVTAWSDAHVEDLLRDEGGRVVGVTGRRGGDRLEARARAVIGADGRFSLVARKVDARVTEERSDVATTLYYDLWDGVADYEPGGPPIAHIHSSCDGFSFVFMPTSRGRTIVLAQGRADAYEALAGAPDAIYEGLLRARPRLWRRLHGARRSGELAGMKRVGNLFREPGGPGWALCGDAYHQKDSIDAQGIYDALLGAKELAAQVVRWHRGRLRRVDLRRLQADVRRDHAPPRPRDLLGAPARRRQDADAVDAHQPRLRPPLRRPRHPPARPRRLPHPAPRPLPRRRRRPPAPPPAPPRRRPHRRPAGVTCPLGHEHRAPAALRRGRPITWPSGQ